MINFSDLYPPPRDIKREDGSSRYCYMTFLMRNDAYLPGALVFAYTLKKMGTQADIVCMVTNQISSSSRVALELIFDRVVDVEEVFIPHHHRHQRQDRPFLFTRFKALLAGEDGSLGMRYEKLVLADADVLPITCFDHLFTLATPAGIINESKFNCMEYDHSGRYIIPSSVGENGKWKWHKIYDPVCPHGKQIPKLITDRIINDPMNLGVNSSLWVLSPSARVYHDILQQLNESDSYSTISRTYNWPEMQFASVYWSGQWTNIDLRFSSFNGYPKLDVLCGTHFAGYKPWNFKEVGTISRFSRFPDYQKWHQQYIEMVDQYPKLHENKKLFQIYTKILDLKVKGTS